MILKNNLTTVWKNHWEMTQLIERAKEWMQQYKLRSHIQLEKAIWRRITSPAYEHKGTIHFNNFQELPIRGKQLINNDESEIPYIRVRKGGFKTIVSLRIIEKSNQNNISATRNDLLQYQHRVEFDRNNKDKSQIQTFKKEDKK